MPTHFVGDPNYISDTEYTPVIQTEKHELNADNGNINLHTQTQNHLEL
jgi:hypothetical protein